MSSFIRFAGAAAVVFSLGLFVSALPVTYTGLQVPTGTDAISRVCANLVVHAKLEAHLKALPLCANIDELKLKIAVVVVMLKGCADELLKIGANVAVDADAKVSLVACIVSIITLCVQVFVTLSIKFGLTICAEIDVVLRLLLANLNLCVKDILALIAKGLAQATVGLFAQLNFKLCASVLGL